MPKAERKQTGNMANDLSNDAKSLTNSNLTSLQTQQNDAKTRQASGFNNAYEGYLNQQKTGGYDEGRLTSLRANVDDIGKTGGYDPERLANLRTQFDTYSKSGGFDPNELSYIRSKGKDFVDNGGYDAGSTGTIRSGYTDFATTGGFNEGDKVNFRNNATNGVSSVYKGLQAQAANERAKTGGLGSGGALLALGRQGANAYADAQLAAENDLNAQIRSGKLSGLSGLTNFESGLADRKQNALRGLGDIESAVASNNRSVMDSSRALESDVAGGRLKGIGLGADLETSVANNRNAANKGFADLYNTATGETTELGNQVLRTLGLRFDNQAQAAQIMQELSRQPGVLQSILNSATQIGGMITGGITGLQGLGGIKVPVSGKLGQNDIYGG